MNLVTQCTVRTMVAVTLGFVGWLTSAAQQTASASAAPRNVTVDRSLGISVVPLYSDRTGDDAPTLTVFETPGRGNGSAVIIAPGGSYTHLSMNLEGRAVADWFTARGVTAFVLKYRLGAANQYPVPLQDAQRAVRLVRSMSETYRLDPYRIGIMGFSAGGHLAAMEATSFDAGSPSSSDAVERVSSKPDFLVLGYAWLGAMEMDLGQPITYCSTLKLSVDKCREWAKLYSPEMQVTAATPPTFLYATTDDATVPVMQSVAFYGALVRAKVPAELHIFRHGAHGSGLGIGDAALDAWPGLLEGWLRGQGLLTRVTAAEPPKASAK